MKSKKNQSAFLEYFGNTRAFFDDNNNHTIKSELNKVTTSKKPTKDDTPSEFSIIPIKTDENSFKAVNL